MSYKLSTKDIHFFEPLNILGNFCLITPLYNLKSRLFFKPVVATLYAIFLASVEVYSLNRALGANENLPFFLFMRRVNEDAAWIVAIILSLVQILGATWWHNKKWKVLFDTFEDVDTNLRNRGLKAKTTVRNFYFKTTLVFVLFGAFVAHQIYVSVNYLGITDFKYHIVSVYESYRRILLLILSKALLEAARVRYKDLNAKLENCHSPILVVRIRQFGQTYRMLGEIVDLLCDIFCYQYIILLAHCLGSVLNCMNFYNFESKLLGDPTHALVANQLAFLFVLYAAVSPAMACNSVKDEARKFIRTCYLSQDKFKGFSRERLELMMLAQYAQSFVPSFSIKGPLGLVRVPS